MPRIAVIDSHTAGEPTRVVIDGGPDLGAAPLADRALRLRHDHDRFRRAVVNEPRGSEVLVGALLIPPCDPASAAGVIFFNNVGYLGMCGHGTIGLVATLAQLGRIAPGEHKIETPVGVVTTILHDDGSVSVTNVPSYRRAKQVEIDLPGIGRVTGDVAWGGNWFFLVEAHGQSLDVANADSLLAFTKQLRAALHAAGYGDVDHVELFGPATVPGAHSRNFVLCPGGAYDRSPCGTGTSAKLACLAADGKLAENETWVQESIVGTTFAGRYTWRDRAAGQIAPTITGVAYITAEATLLIDDRDPLGWGL
jgi:4-hydroxyproline epimerase